MTDIDHHNPILDKYTCGLCATAMRLTFVEMADIPGTPMGTIQLVEMIREIADRKVQLLRRNPDYNFMWNLDWDKREEVNFHGGEYPE